MCLIPNFSPKCYYLDPSSVFLLIYLYRLRLLLWFFIILFRSSTIFLLLNFLFRSCLFALLWISLLFSFYFSVYYFINFVFVFISLLSLLKYTPRCFVNASHDFGTIKTKLYAPMLEPNQISQLASYVTQIWNRMESSSSNWQPIECGTIDTILDDAIGFPLTEIYRIVSQKQMRDPPEGDTIRPHNVETIDVKPTVHNDSMRKQCCQTS